jgi:hypothetical protein
MRNPRKRSLLIIPALMALALGTAVLGQLPAAARTAAAVDDPDKAYAAVEAGPSNCFGGAQKASLVRQNDQPVSIGENGAAFTPLPWAQLPFAGPAAGDTDQVAVTFAAEARLTGQLFAAVPADFVQVRILLDGVPMAPLNDLMFTTGIGAANATLACKRVPHDDNGHIVRVDWRLVDQNGGALNGIVDDASLKVEISE